MNKFADELEKRLTATIDKIQRTLQAIRDLPEAGRLSSTTDLGYIFVNIPFVIDLSYYREILGPKWLEDKDLVTQDCNGDKYYRFIHKLTGIPLVLRVDSHKRYNAGYAESAKDI